VIQIYCYHYYQYTYVISKTRKISKSKKENLLIFALIMMKKNNLDNTNTQQLTLIQAKNSTEFTD